MSEAMFGRVLKGAALGVLFAISAGVTAWFFLPAVPAGEWSWIVRAFLSLVVGSIAFALVWFLTVVSTMKGAF